MTINSQTRKAGPYVGTGSTGPFSFSFKIFQASDVLVVKVNNTTDVETELTLTTDYTVSLNADQNANPGGSITLVSALAVGYNMVISSQVPFTQQTDLTNQGGFYPEVITDALDKLTIQTQQLKEGVDRSAKLPITSQADPVELGNALVVLADNYEELEIVADNINSVVTVGDNISNVNATATNINSVNNFSAVYQGAFATNPSARTIGGSLQDGDLYFNTSTELLRVYKIGTGWFDAAIASPVTITIEKFSGTGSQTNFTLSVAPGFTNAITVEISGVGQRIGTDFTTSGTTLSFTTAPPSGTNNIYVTVISSYAGGVPNNGSVTAEKLAAIIDLGVL